MSPFSAISSVKAWRIHLADYLGEDTQTKVALDIIDGEFGMTGSIQVMVLDISADQAEEIADRSQPQTIYSEVPKVWGAPRAAHPFSCVCQETGSFLPSARRT